MFKTLLTSCALALSLAGFAAADAPMAFDVAEDHTRIFMADTPLHENWHARSRQCLRQSRLHLPGGHP